MKYGETSVEIMDSINASTRLNHDISLFQQLEKKLVKLFSVIQLANSCKIFFPEMKIKVQLKLNICSEVGIQNSSS